MILSFHEHQGFSPEQAGMLGSVNLLGGAAGSLAVAVFARRLATMPVALAALAIAVLADLVTPMMRGLTLLTILRFSHGVAAGMVLGVAYREIGRSKTPERVFGLTVALQLVESGLSVIVGPALLNRFGSMGIYIPMAGLEAIAVPLFAFSSFVASNSTTLKAKIAAPVPWSKSPLAWAALVGIFLFQGSRFMTVAFGFEVGELFKLPQPFVGATLGLSTWLGAFGALGAVWLGKKVGRTGPLLLYGLCSLAGTSALLMWGSSKPAFAMVNALAVVVTFLALPYTFSICAEIDRSGRLTLWTGFVSKLGLAAGPLAGGWAYGHWGLVTLLIVSAIGGVAAIASSSFPAHRLDRRRNTPPDIVLETADALVVR
jgi:predicted MFS family arabinose efflux permease